MMDGAKEVLVISGAGASADSDIPTFRSSDHAWWKRGFGVILLLFGYSAGWRQFPRLCWWGFDRWFRRPIMRAMPNACHTFFGKMDEEGKWVRIITQNVDGMHQRGGTPPEHVAEIHGTIWRTLCAECKCVLRNQTPVPYVAYGDDDDDFKIPKCRDDHSAIRPDVTLFGERLPEDEFNKGCQFVNEMSGGFGNESVVVVIGTSGQVGTIFSFLNRCQGKNKKIILIDPNPTEVMLMFANAVIRDTAQHIFS